MSFLFQYGTHCEPAGLIFPDSTELGGFGIAHDVIAMMWNKTKSFTQMETRCLL